MCRQSSHPSCRNAISVGSIYIYIFKDFFDSPPPTPLLNVYTYSLRVGVRVNSIVFTAFTIRIKTLKRYSFRLVVPPHLLRDINVHILCARRRLHTNPAQQLRWIKKKTQIRIRSNTMCIYNIIYRPYNIEQYRNIEKINRKKND